MPAPSSSTHPAGPTPVPAPPDDSFGPNMAPPASGPPGPSAATAASAIAAVNGAKWPAARNASRAATIATSSPRGGLTRPANSDT